MTQRHVCTALTAALLSAVAVIAHPAAAATAVATAASAPALSWTDWADLALAAPVVILATVDDIDRLGAREAPGAGAGEMRALVVARLTAALRAGGVLPAKAAWIWQGPAGPRGRAPFAKSAPVIVFGSPLTGGGDASVQPLRLISRNGQQPWSAEAEAEVRAILSEALKPGADGLMVTAVRDGFRSEGDVPGASESQFFLSTQGGRPLTLMVRRAPGAPADTLVASGELVDRAGAVTPRTLLWRGLACGMPAALPPTLAADAALQADYEAARTAIGVCGRTLTPP